MSVNYENIQIVGMQRPRSVERVFLIVGLLLVFWSLPGLGRDVFFNGFENRFAGDPIGERLNLIRGVVSSALIVGVSFSATPKWAFSKFPAALVPFCFVIFYSSLSNPDASGLSMRYAVIFVMMATAISMVIHRLGLFESVRVALHMIAVVCIVSCMLAVLVPSIGVHTGNEWFQASHVGQWRGIFSHKNGLGSWAAAGSVFLLTHGRWMGGPILYWRFAWLCAVACLVKAESSTALLATVAMFGMMMLFTIYHRFGRPMAIAILVLGLFVVLPFAIFGASLVFELLGKDTTFTGRTVIWEIAWRHILDRPLFGHGFGSLGGADFLNEVYARVHEPIPGPESGYFTLLIESGFIGALCYFVPVFLSYRNGFKWLPFLDRREAASIEYMLVVNMGFLIMAFSDSSSLALTGFDGVLTFGSTFALMTMPRCPADIARAHAKTAEAWVEAAELREAQVDQLRREKEKMLATPSWMLAEAQKRDFGFAAAPMPAPSR